MRENKQAISIKEDQSSSKEVKHKKSSQLNKDIKKLYFLSNLKMRKKYDINPKKYNKFVINTLLNSENCHLVAIFKEQLLSNYYQEFLRRQYKISEARERIPKFSGYYKNYLFFFCKPTFTNFQMNSIINNYGEKRAEIYYKKVYQGGKSSEEDENNDGFQESDSEEDSKSEQKNNNETRLINTGIKDEIDNVTIMTTISSNGNNNTINLNLENEKIEVFSENKCEKSTDTTFHEILDVIAKKNNIKSSRKNKKFLTNINTMMEFKKAIIAKRISNKNKHVKSNTKSIINANNTNNTNTINNNENKNIHNTIDKKMKYDISQNEQKEKSKIINKNNDSLKLKNDLKKSINKLSLNKNNVFAGNGYSSLLNGNKSVSPQKKNKNNVSNSKKIVINNNFIRDNISKNTKIKKNYFKLSRNYNTNGLLYSNTTSNQNCNYNYNFEFIGYKSDYNNLYNNKNTISLNKLNENLKKENFSKTANENNNHFPSNSNEKVNRVSSLKFLITENDKKKTNFKLYAGKLNNKIKNNYNNPLTSHQKNTNLYIGSFKNISKKKQNINSHKCLNNNLKSNAITSNNENIKYKHQHYNSLSNQLNFNEINSNYTQSKKKNKINIPVPPLPIGATVIYDSNSISSNNNNNSGSVNNNIFSHCINNENSGKKYIKNKNLKYYYNNNNYNININNQIIINTNANCCNANFNNKKLQNYISSRNKKTEICLNDLQKGGAKLLFNGNGGGVIATFPEKETKSKNIVTHTKKLRTRNISSGLKYFNTNFNNIGHNSSKNNNIIKSYHCKNISSLNQNQKLISLYKSLNEHSGSKEKNNLKK